MSADVEPNDWVCMDPWWSAYTQTQSIAQNPPPERILEINKLANCWNELDSWWKEYTAASPDPKQFDTTGSSDYWEELDPWWEIYTEIGHETAEEIAELIDKSNIEWQNSDAPFDKDPMAADLTRNRFGRGPLQPSSEVEWSRWLAQLIFPSEALVTELFDVVVDQSPEEVIREDRLSKHDEGFRRPDILVFQTERGISIEVKLNDENYRKTAETAELVERHYNNRKWIHTLLLPKSKSDRLDSIVDPPLTASDGDQLSVQWDNPGPVDVLYWRDVTAAIRSVLQTGEVVDNHWAANAYLFCTVAEQRILNFQPYSVIQQLADPENVVEDIHPIKIGDTLEEQLKYLRETVRS